MKVISQYVIIFRYIVLNLSQTYVSLKMYFIKHKINMLKEEMVIKLRSHVMTPSLHN